MVLYFSMWFKNGLKAQKLLAQGIALGKYGRKPVALEGQKLYYYYVFKAFALTGRLAVCHYTQGDALG